MVLVSSGYRWYRHRYKFAQCDIYIYIDNVFSNLPRFANVLVSGCWKTAGFQGFWEFNGYAGVRYIGFCMFLRHVMTYMFVSYLPLLYRLEPSRLKRERVY